MCGGFGIAGKEGARESRDVFDNSEDIFLLLLRGQQTFLIHIMWVNCCKPKCRPPPMSIRIHK